MGCFTSQKKKYKKMFLKAFRELNSNLLRIAIIGLQDYDAVHNTKKLDKYLTKAIVEEKDSKDGRKLVKNIMSDFFIEPEPTPEPTPEPAKLIDIAIQKNPNLIDQKLNEIEKRKLNILYRKDLIKQKKKAERKNRVGRMG